MLLQVAVKLLAPVPEEKESRSAINRAYYAAFGEAHEYSVTHGLNIQNRRSIHEQVWQFLRRGATYSQTWEAAAQYHLVK
jgi:hypothetical protein